jgi:hypothetical protein
MIVSKVTYAIRRNLGNYEHEDLSIEIGNSVEKPSTAEEMFNEARKQVILATTAQRLKLSSGKKE